MPTVALTIDLDPLSAYYAIHGISSPPAGDPVLGLGIRRFLNLAKEYRVPATLFVTGSFITEEGWALLRDAAAAGCELADHSFSHDYRLSRRPQEDIETDLKRNAFVIREYTGVSPVGFRAPGYNTSPAMRAAIAAAGYRYDSSALPSLFYHSAKQALIWIKRVTGHRSVSFVSSLRDACGPRDPHRLPEGPIEAPITTVFPLLGLPLVGTAIVTFPAPLVHLMVSRALRKEFVVIELHAIDFVEADDDPELRPLLGKQPDISHPVERKLRRLSRMIERFLEKGFAFETLADATSRFS